MVVTRDVITMVVVRELAKEFELLVWELLTVVVDDFRLRVVLKAKADSKNNKFAFGNIKIKYMKEYFDFVQSRMLHSSRFF